MGHVQTPEFTRRLKNDGAIDSFCTRCFVCVATSTSSIEVKTQENQHMCDPLLLHLLRRYMRLSHLLSAA